MVGYWFIVKVRKGTKTICFIIASTEEACRQKFREKNPTDEIYGMSKMSEKEMNHYLTNAHLGVLP
jgi:hypothetical protein